MTIIVNGSHGQLDIGSDEARVITQNGVIESTAGVDFDPGSANGLLTVAGTSVGIRTDGGDMVIVTPRVR